MKGEEAEEELGRDDAVVLLLHLGGEKKKKREDAEKAKDGQERQN